MSYILTLEKHPNNETRLSLSRKRQIRVRGDGIKTVPVPPLALETGEENPVSVVSPSNLTFVGNSKPDDKSLSAHQYARTTFGINARRRISRAAGCMDRIDPSPENYLFLTATLPSDNVVGKWAIANYSHEVINLLKAWLSKRVQSRLEFYVWELQSRGALHFHYCIHVPDQAARKAITSQFKVAIARIYDTIGEKFGTDLWGRWADMSFESRVEILQARVEQVYSSVGAYMAGYLAGKGDKHSRDAEFPNYPKRWFGVSRTLSREISLRTERGEQEFGTYREASMVFDDYERNLDSEAISARSFPHKVGEGKTYVSYHETPIQQELWEQMMKPTRTISRTPNISRYTLLALKCLREVQANSRASRFLATHLPATWRHYFDNPALELNLRSGNISRQLIQFMDAVFSAYDWSAASSWKEQMTGRLLRCLSQSTSAYYSQMIFSSDGWLMNSEDFRSPIDVGVDESYLGTKSKEQVAGSEDSCEPTAPPESSDPPYVQLCL